MKLAISRFLALSTICMAPLSAFASNPISTSSIANECYWNAQTFVSLQSGRDYDQDGLHAYSCFLAPNKKAVICDVSASKGDGAATDTYRVVMNLTCTKAYRVELTGEE